MSDDPERAAFVAGFSVSTEGYNGEWGPQNEWIELHFEKWKHGTPLPRNCGAYNADAPGTTVCTRPAGHEPPHRAVQGYSGFMEWS